MPALRKGCLEAGVPQYGQEEVGMRWILFGFTLPWSVTVGWGWVALMFCIGAAKRLRWEERGLLTAVWRDWVIKPRKCCGRRRYLDGQSVLDSDGNHVYNPLWKYSTTLGRGIVFQPDDRRKLLVQPLTMVEKHERVHVDQAEDLMLRSFVIGLAVFLCTGDWLLGLAIWSSGGGWQLTNFVTAAIRHGIKNAYRDSEHERSAYASTTTILPEDVGKSWIDVREEQIKASSQS